VVKRTCYVYAMGYTGLSTFVVADPHAPKYLSTLGLADIYDGYGPYFHGATVGSHLYISAGDLLDVDLSNPSSPSVATTIENHGYVLGVAAKDSILSYARVVGTGQACTLCVRVENQTTSVSTGAWLGYSVAVADGHVYVACGDSGIALYELRREE
jgi:hypothetical protein